MGNVSELDRIGIEGAALDAGGIPAPDLDATSRAPAGPTEADQVAMWAAIPATFGSILAMAMPELAAVYSPEACTMWGTAMVPVAKKYGWNDLANLPEISLCLVSLPFAIGTFSAVKHRRTPAAAAAEGKGAPDPKVAPAPSGPSVNAGVV